MKGSVKVDVVRRILELSLVSEAPLRLTHQIEWHEFIPLGFLLIQSLRPQRILEVGTAIGDSYLSFCQAVQACNLMAECTCIPRSKSGRQEDCDSPRLEEFRAYHDALYAKFSEIETAGISSRRMQGDRYKFNLIHIISPDSANELEELCRAWLPRLSFSGVALISGQGQFDQSLLTASLAKVCQRFCVRTLQLQHWVAILSVKPIGIVSDLLLTSDDEFCQVAKLLGWFGDRIRLHGSQLVQEENSKKLTSRLARSEESEINAQIRFGQTALRLDLMWAEKEELRKRLQGTEDGNRASGGESSTEEENPTPRDGCLSEGAKGILLRILQLYLEEYDSPVLRGRDSWDDCGRSLLASILAKQHRLRFPKPSKPTISVIVVLRNKVHLSVLCLCSLLLETNVDYELIVVDNGSSDETSAVLSLVDSASIIRNGDNLGFGPATMQGVSRASGEFLCLLNNDALLQHGSLATALNVFSERPDTGAVGGKVLLADGRLQEAGCIIWRDGRAKQYGREDEASLPQYNFRRPVDYCSGAFLVTPRLLFREVGGFDDRYAPAYYEDVDYCMKLWHARRPVIYEPRALVHHYEGASSVSSATTREAIVVNHRRFTERWRDALRDHQAERPENIIRARIAAQCESTKCLYFFGELPDQLSELYKDPRLQQIGALVRDGNVVTCLYVGEHSYADARKFFAIDVELRGLNSMATNEVDDYCTASDMIVVAAAEESKMRIRGVFDEHSSKITRVQEVPRV